MIWDSRRGLGNPLWLPFSPGWSSLWHISIFRQQFIKILVCTKALKIIDIICGLILVVRASNNQFEDFLGQGEMGRVFFSSILDFSSICYQKIACCINLHQFASISDFFSISYHPISYPPVSLRTQIPIRIGFLSYLRFSFYCYLISFCYRQRTASPHLFATGYQYQDSESVTHSQGPIDSLRQQ